MPNNAIDAVIARVKQLDAAATPGPWFESHNSLCHTNHTGPITGGVSPVAVVGENRKLIAAYRTDAPALAAECERLRGRVAELERVGMEIVEASNTNDLVRLLKSIDGLILTLLTPPEARP